MRETISRRVLVVRATQITLLAPFVGCKRAPVVCTEGSLGPEDLAARKATGYVDKAPDAARSCAGCRQYVAAASSDACGTCRLLKGAIHPEGTCKLFAAR